MKLNAEQVEQIELYLEKDAIFYEYIRHEMTDHIATALEEDPALNNENFEAMLRAYMNSHHKVKLLTAARKEENIRDRKYKRYFLKQFLTISGLLLLLSVYAIIYLAGLNKWTERLADLLLIAAMCMSIWYTKPLKQKHPFILRLIGTTGLYYVVLVIMATQLHRFNGLESSIVNHIEKIATGIMFTGYILMFKTNNYYKKQRYA